MPNWLGDAVMATPLLAIARRKWKNAYIAVQTKQSLAPLYDGNPYIDEILHQTPKGFDIGILTTNSLSSAWEFFQARIKTRIGFTRDGRFFLLTKKYRYPRRSEHLVTTYKRLLDAENDASAPQIFVAEKDRKKAETILRDLGIFSKKILGINALAAYGPAKCWLPERFREVARRCEHAVVFFGDKAGEEEIEEMCRGTEAINLAGKTTLRQLIALIGACDIFLTNDSGPMHIAAALGTPLVALFGSTSDVETGPYRFGRVIHKKVPCSPCFRRTCPIDFPCMKKIEAEEVLDALRTCAKARDM